MSTDVVISNNFAFGGANACVVFRRPAAGESSYEGATASSFPGASASGRERPVITGMAALTPAGDLRRAVDAVRTAGGPPDAGLLDDGFGEMIPRPQRRKLDRLGKATVAVATLALADAGLDGGRRVGVVMGTALGPMESMEEFMRPLLDEGPAAAGPALFPNTVYNAAAGHVGIVLGTLGPTSTVTAGHAAGAAALGYCTDILVARQADAMLCVAADMLTPTVVRAYREIGAVGRGLRLAEAAVGLVLEQPDAAYARGAATLATVLGQGSASDAVGIGRWDAEGAGVERAVRAALAEAGLAARDVEAIWPHACGLRAADRAEEAALQRLFPASCPIHRPKRAVGDALGAGGPLNVALALAGHRSTAHGSTAQTALFISSSLGGSHVATIIRLHASPPDGSAGQSPERKLP